MCSYFKKGILVVNQLSESVSAKQNIAANETELADDFDLLDVINFIRRNFIYMLWGALLGLAIGGLLVVLLPKQFEATALVKIGEIANVNAAGTVTGSTIEPSLQVVDRIKSRSFQDDVLKVIKISVDDDDNALVKQFRNSLKVKLEKSELISLSVNANSRAQAGALMQGVVNQLNTVHYKMSYPAIARLKLELDSVNNEIKLADEESKKFPKVLDTQSENVTDLKFLQTVLLSSIRMSKAQEYRNFRDNKRMLEEKLSPERTFPTHVLGRVEVSKKPVSPKFSILIPAGLFLGLFASFAYILFISLRLKLASVKKKMG